MATIETSSSSTTTTGYPPPPYHRPSSSSSSSGGGGEIQYPTKKTTGTGNNDWKKAAKIGDRNRMSYCKCRVMFSPFLLLMVMIGFAMVSFIHGNKQILIQNDITTATTTTINGNRNHDEKESINPSSTTTSSSSSSSSSSLPTTSTSSSLQSLSKTLTDFAASTPASTTNTHNKGQTQKAKEEEEAGKEGDKSSNGVQVMMKQESKPHSNLRTTTTTTTTASSTTNKNATTTTTTAAGSATGPKKVRRYKLEIHGLGVDLSKASHQFYKAIVEDGYDEYVVISNRQTDGWHYARGVCPTQDLACYFQSPPVDVVPKDDDDAMRMLTIPKPEIQNEIDTRLKESSHAKPPSDHECGVIHVRHSDTMLNFGWDNKDEKPKFKYLQLGQYLKEFHNVAPHITNIVLMTDDQNVIDDLNANYTTNTNSTTNSTNGFPNWYYLNKKRWRGSEGGFENHFPSGSPRQEMIDLLVLREMVHDCTTWVGTRSSFGALLRKTMPNLVQSQIKMLNNKN